MRRSGERLTVMLALLALLLSLPQAVGAVEYTFTKIVDSNCQEFFCDVFTNFGLHPAINERGMVAFFVRREGVNLDIVDFILVSDGRRFTTIADTTDPMFIVGGLRGDQALLSINDSGRVAFEAVLEEGGVVVGLFIGDGRTITRVAQASSAAFLSNAASINNAGTVAFAFLEFSERAIKLVKHGLITTLLDNSGPFSFFALPSINDPGTVVFRGGLHDDTTFGIFTADRTGTVTTIAEQNDYFIAFSSFPSLNNKGTVVFTALVQGGVFGVFTGDGSTITTVADTNGPFSTIDVSGRQSADSASINNKDTVAFAARLDDGRKGIFTGPDPVADKVIITGDSLFGLSVIDLSLGKEGLNNSGQIAFHARLADGTEGVYRADPRGVR